MIGKPHVLDKIDKKLVLFCFQWLVLVQTEAMTSGSVLLDFEVDGSACIGNSRHRYFTPFHSCPLVFQVWAQSSVIPIHPALPSCSFQPNALQISGSFHFGVRVTASMNCTRRGS